MHLSVLNVYFLSEKQNKIGIFVVKVRNIIYIFSCKRHLLTITRIYLMENILLYVHHITIVSIFLFDKCYETCKIWVTLNMTAAISCFLIIIIMLFLSIDTCPPHITDAAWRLEYCIKVRCFFKLCQSWLLLYSLSYNHCFSRQNSHLHKVNQPSYLISLNTEVCNFRYSYMCRNCCYCCFFFTLYKLCFLLQRGAASSEINFSCTMEQLQVFILNELDH